MNSKEIIDELKISVHDLQLLEVNKISLPVLKRQVEQLRKGTKFVKLFRVCKIGDGIKSISEENAVELISLQEEYKKKKIVLKFVPASGAASRMFKKLESYFMSDEISNIENSQASNDEKYIHQFFINLKRFAFYQDLSDIIAIDGNNLESMISDRKFNLILEYLLTPRGLNYSHLPKALIKFHSYDSEFRNSFEEQILEAIGYINNSEQEVKLHFTINEHLQDVFEQELRSIKNKHDAAIKLNISFSFQKKSTNTVALDLNDNLFRENDNLLLRPGGHGALIENLNDLHADLIYIKNIDNVQREENLSQTIMSKKMIGGLLIEYQSIIYSFLRKLESDENEDLLNPIVDFITSKLDYYISADLLKASETEKRKYLFDFLNRPIRVCGVVLNEDHPGGGPFWVEEDKGQVSKQIVERNQIDTLDQSQKEIFNSSSHFNPVDIVCGVKDYKGKKFNLLNFVDEQVVLVSIKSKDGKELKALELPGLWNGGMANWITLFVEVPKETFTPVKEVTDLLMDYHLASL